MSRNARGEAAPRCTDGGGSPCSTRRHAAAEAEIAKLQTKEPKGDDGDGEEEWEKAVDAVAAFLFAPKKKR